MRTTGGFLAIGVIDSNLGRNRAVGWNSENLLTYYGRDGTLWGDGRGKINEKARRLADGDEVLVRTDARAGEIGWEINGKL